MTMQAHILRAAGAVANSGGQIDLVGVSYASGNSGSLNISVPAGTEDGDLLVFCLMNLTRTAPLTISLPFTTEVSNPTGSPLVMSRFFSSGDPSSVSASFTGGNTTGLMASYRGSTGVDVSGVFSGTSTAASISPLKQGVLLALFTATAAGGENLSPAGMESRVKNYSQNPSMSLYDLNPSGPGPTGDKSTGWINGGNQNSVLFQIS